MDKLKVAVAGGSGYAGGELLRILLFHPRVEVTQVTSERNRGDPVSRIHPNLRGTTPIKFCSIDDLESCDLLFASLPHGKSMQSIDRFKALAPSIIDLSGDFRLDDPAGYMRWYGVDHPRPDLLDTFVYGIPELHREAMRSARFVSSAGCNATATILALHPLFAADLVEPFRTVVEVKAGTSQGGHRAGPSSHHPERSGSIRTYKPAGHRHVAEMIQELGSGNDIHIHFTATSIDMVRGVHAVCHVFLKDEVDEKTIWQLYRQAYGSEPFVRIVKERKGIHRFPDPRLLAGTNFCEIGFERDPDARRLVVFSAIDNLVKGAAGQAVQAFNIMNGFDETEGLTFPGLHPV